jgi:hypothetical protein
MAPVNQSRRPSHCPSTRRARALFLVIAAVLVCLLPAPVRGSAQEAVDSLTILSFECSGDVPLDGSPLAAANCSGESDRTFTLSGPDGREADIRTTLEPNPDNEEIRRATWSVILDDEVTRDGTWSLREVEPDQQTGDLVSCLKVIGFKFAPAALDFGDDRSVSFDWNAAVRLNPSTIAGQFLECNWFAVPDPQTDERPGLLTIKNAVGSDPSEANLVVVEPDGESQGFSHTESADVPSASFTLNNDDSGEELELRTDDSSGDLSTTFALVPGDYTITAIPTGKSASFTIEEGQTVLALNTLAEPPADRSDPTPIVINVEPTETPVPLPTAEDIPEVVAPQVFEFAASDWTGAYPDLVIAVYGRDCVAVYGVRSQYPSARLTFAAEDPGNGHAELVLDGLDDEWAGQVPIEVTVNGELVYQGRSGFASWDPNLPEANWSQTTIAFDAGLIVAGQNEIVVTNLSDAANFGIPPYILLAQASLRVG